MNGYCDIVIMGNGFGSKLDAQFQTLANLVKKNLLKREPFLSRQSELNFHFINSRQNFTYTLSGGLETALSFTNADIRKIKKELGATPMNILHVLAWNEGYGGASGNLSATGLNKLIDPFAGDPNYCSHDLITRATDGISPHEIGHSCGCGHDDTTLNTMAGAYTTNGGCQIVGTTFTTTHQQIISNFIDRTKLNL